MTLTEKERLFLKNNEHILGEIFRKKQIELMDRIMDRPMGDGRDALLEVAKLWREEVRTLKVLGKSKKVTPKSFV